MQDEGKRILIRVPTDRWRDYDDRRHAERTTFQELGCRFFEAWMEGNKIIARIPGNRSEKSDNIDESNLVSGPDEKWVQALLGILRSGNDVAARAIKSNLLTFLDYVYSVPQGPNEFTDIATETERLAAIDRRVDAIKAAAMAGGGGASKAGKADAPEAHRKRTRPGSA
jgi:hypothetical protein